MNSRSIRPRYVSRVASSSVRPSRRFHHPGHGGLHLVGAQGDAAAAADAPSELALHDPHGGRQAVEGDLAEADRGVGLMLRPEQERGKGVQVHRRGDGVDLDARNAERRQHRVQPLRPLRLERRDVSLHGERIAAGVDRERGGVGEARAHLVEEFARRRLAAGVPGGIEGADVQQTVERRPEAVARVRGRAVCGSRRGLMGLTATPVGRGVVSDPGAAVLPTMCYRQVGAIA